MDDNMRNDIENLLNGKITIEESQAIVSRISEDDFKKIPLSKLNSMMEAYRSRNKFKPEPVYHVTDSEKNEIWQRIKAGVEKTSPSGHGLFNRIGQVFKTMFSFEAISYHKFGVALTALLIFVVVPSVIIKIHQKTPVYTGIKGDELPAATLRFALVGLDEKLIRPDRPITESDTIAFRINVQREGYFSICVVYQNKADFIVTDKFLEQGVFDLEEIYNLSGNQGMNTLVLLSAKTAISVDDKIKKTIIHEANENKAPFLTINQTTCSVSYQNINIE